MGFEARERACLVDLHQPAVTHHISCDDRCEPALWSGHAYLSPYFAESSLTDERLEPKVGSEQAAQTKEALRNLRKAQGLPEHARSLSEGNGKKEDLAAERGLDDSVNSETGKRLFVFPDWAGWMTVRCGPYRCRRAKRMSPSQKISKKAPAARLIVCPYRARAHPLLSAHEGFGSLTIEKNIVLAAAAVDRLLARPQCDEIVELIKLGRMRHQGASEPPPLSANTIKRTERTSGLMVNSALQHFLDDPDFVHAMRAHDDRNRSQDTLTKITCR
jgi:hypothetical protein